MPRIVTSRWRRAAVPAALAMAVVSTAAMRLPGGAWAANGAAGAPIFLPLTARGFDLSDRPPATVVTPAPSPTATATAAGSATSPSPSPIPSPTASPTREGYSEPLTDFAELDDLRASYSAARWYPTLLAVLERRYATGRFIVAQLEDSEAAARRWAGNRTGSWDDLINGLQLVVHEMNHQLGMQEGVEKTRFGRYAYVVRADEMVTVTYHETYPRSEIARYVTGPLENMYKSVYLSGRSGEQGFQNLLDELNAYTHSLFTAYGVHDQFPTGLRATHRDGLVTFMMYTEFYLRHGREHHPDDWELLHDDPEMRALVALLWDRAEFILDTTEDIPGLAMEPEAIEAEMRRVELQEEIARFVAP